MTEPIDQATKDRIAWIADTSSSSPWESQRMKIFGERIAKDIATAWAEKLKQERELRKELVSIVEYYHDKQIQYTEMPYKNWNAIIKKAKEL